METLVWLAFILILVEYNFRLRRSAQEKIEEGFNKLKEEFLKKEEEKKAADDIEKQASQ